MRNLYDAFICEGKSKCADKLALVINYGTHDIIYSNSKMRPINSYIYIHISLDIHIFKKKKDKTIKIRNIEEPSCLYIRIKFHIIVQENNVLKKYLLTQFY